MLYKIAKEYKWEMSHRLPFHKGPCRNIHGHSYNMRVILEGNLNEEAMLMDFYDLDEIITPIVNDMDHSFMCDKDDSMMITFLEENDLKIYIVPEYTTVENLTKYMLDKLTPDLKKFENLASLTVRIHETEDSYAELTGKL